MNILLYRYIITTIFYIYSINKVILLFGKFYIYDYAYCTYYSRTHEQTHNGPSVFFKFFQEKRKPKIAQLLFRTKQYDNYGLGYRLVFCL